MNAEQTREILKKVRQIEIRTKRLVTDSLAGQYHSVFKGRGMNFDTVREYAPGDEVRTIDWNVTARTGRPFVKKFVEERELTLLLMVDVSASGDFGSGTQSKRELAAEIASVLAFSAIRNSDKVGLLLFSDQVELYVPPRKGRRHVLRIVREVLGFEPQRRGTDLGIALDFVNDVLKRRAIVFMLSDFQTSGPEEDSIEGLRRSLRQTSRRHDLVALSIYDAREKSLPDLGIVTIEDAETGELVELDTRNPIVRVCFAKLAEARALALQRAFRAEAIDSFPVETDQPYVVALTEFFKNRTHRRSCGGGCCLHSFREPQLAREMNHRMSEPTDQQGKGAQNRPRFLQGRIKVEAASVETVRLSRECHLSRL